MEQASTREYFLARIDRLSDFYPIFVSDRFVRVYVVHFCQFLITFLSCYLAFLEESLLVSSSYEFIVVNFYLERREI